MDRVNMSIEVVKIADEIKVVGLSFQNLELPETVESLGEMRDIYGKKHRGKVDQVMPPMDYGVNAVLTPDKHKYIAGYAVTKIGAPDKNWTSFVVPAGKYIKHIRNNRGFVFK